MFPKNILFKNVFKRPKINVLNKCELLKCIPSTSKKTSGSFYVCIVCYDYSQSKNFIQCHSDHHICKNCVKQMAKTNVYSISYNTVIKGFPCPHYDCQEHLGYDTCSKFLSKKTQKQIQTKINEAMLTKAEIEYEKCPKCDYLAERFDEKIFECLNCSYKFCYNCNKKCGCNHDYEKCAKNEQKKYDKLSEALIHRCYKCNVPFVKIDGQNEGCNQMDCKCGASQCYACRKPIHGRHNCMGKRLKAHDIHERDVENAKLKYFVKNLI